ncbi:MAG TPA: hypothetical protein VL866_24300 [Pyrinomonadaceae bacterium]|nr:hypothetical protein [Pyrinomonadaceae bacterium]
MTWLDNEGQVRPQSWEEYCEIEAGKRRLPEWMIPSRNYLPQPLHPPPRRIAKEESREKILKMRLRLFHADPHCFWCGQKTLYGAVGNPLQTTVDHLYSRLHPERANRYREQKGVLHVLACSVCNNERGVCEQQQRPFIPKLAERLSFARQADATLAGGGGTSPSQTNSLQGIASEEPSRLPPMRVIQTLEEAIEYARNNPSR